MTNKFLDTVFSFLLLCCLNITDTGKYVYGQTISRSSNLNTSNSGLPTNHIYATATDYLGYMWFATPKGVVRYNGYECRVYDLADGLPTEDVWYLFEDSAKRMWLSSISDELGYIKNERYRPVIRFNPDKGKIYPGIMKPFRDGVAFLNRTRHNLNTGAFDLVRINHSGPQSKEFRVLLKSRIYEFYLNDNLDIISIAYDSIRIRKKGRWLGLRALPKDVKHAYEFRVSQSRYFILMKNKMCFVVNDDAHLVAFDLYEDSPPYDITPFIEQDEKLVYAYRLKNSFYVMSAKRMYVLDEEFEVSKMYDLELLTNGDRVNEKTPCMFFDYESWGPTLSTADKGVYFSRRLSGFH